MAVIEQQQTEWTEIEETWGRDAVRLLHLLTEQGGDGATLGEMRAFGIEAPAQEIYMLQLAGYEIQRLAAGDHSGLCVYVLRSDQRSGDYYAPRR